MSTTDGFCCADARRAKLLFSAAEVMDQLQSPNIFEQMRMAGVAQQMRKAARERHAIASPDEVRELGLHLLDEAPDKACVDSGNTMLEVAKALIPSATGCEGGRS